MNHPHAHFDPLSTVPAARHRCLVGLSFHRQGAKGAKNAKEMQKALASSLRSWRSWRLGGKEDFRNRNDRDIPWLAYGAVEQLS